MKNLLVFDTIEIILAGVTATLFIIQILYYLVAYARPYHRAKKAKAPENNTQPPVSVIIYTKNESANLGKHLPCILSQEYPDYEVIVVNDGSTDESDEVLNLFENEYKNLYHTYIPEGVKYLSRKKLALTVGIKAAKHELLLFTEVNCEPISPQWIASMMRNYSQETQIVLGFCSYGVHKGFLHKLIAYDNLLLGLQYISSTLNGHPYTGNGRNLSYRKELFFAHKGYYKSLSLHAGDDDLFVNELANGKNTRVDYTPESITQMAQVDCFNVWKEMKVSRAATQRYYKGGTLAFYRTEGVSFFLFLIAAATSIVVGVMGNWLIAAFAVLLYLLRLTVKTVVMYKSASLLQQKPALFSLPILELIQPLFNLYVRIYRIFRGKNDYTFRIA
ncbi:MAG: glycosyltransferase [Tannerellaceae bacterium]